MPYASNADLNPQVKHRYPHEHQRTAFRKAFNNALGEYGDESQAFAVAHHAAQSVHNSNRNPMRPQGTEQTHYFSVAHDRPYIVHGSEAQGTMHAGGLHKGTTMPAEASMGEEPNPWLNSVGASPETDPLIHPHPHHFTKNPL